MRSIRHHLSFLLIVLAASLATTVHGSYKDLHKRAGDGITALSGHHHVFLGKTGSSIRESLPGQPRRVEKRHGKSLLSQAIVADYAPVIEPDLTCCHRHYSLFLPGGCPRLLTGNFSLRGPPALI